MRTRRLITDEYQERLDQRLCPRCKKHHLGRVDVEDAESLPKSRFKFEYFLWVCQSDLGHQCYWLSSDLGKAIFESSEGNSPVDFGEPVKKVEEKTTVIRRKKIVDS
jgi:hypothetical protein